MCCSNKWFLEGCLEMVEVFVVKIGLDLSRMDLILEMKGVFECVLLVDFLVF